MDRGPRSIRASPGCCRFRPSSLWDINRHCSWCQQERPRRWRRSASPCSWSAETLVSGQPRKWRCSSAPSAVGLPMLLAAAGELSGLTTRYLVGVWVPLAAIGAAGLTTKGAGRAGPVVTAAICVLFLAIDVGSAWAPKFDRDDWRGAAQALTPPRVKRAIVLSPDLGGPAFQLYRRGARDLPARGEAVREIALVGLPAPYRKVGERPQAPRPVSIPPWSGFAKVSERLGGVFTIVIFRSARPRYVRPGALARRGLGESGATVLFEQPTGR